MTRARSRTHAAPAPHDADTWWSDDTGTVDLDRTAPSPLPSPRRSTRPPVRRRRGVGRLLRIFVAPLLLVSQLMDRSPALRRLGVRIAIVSVMLCIIGGSVGVILINNLVIGRTAELGELDDRRRELRRENALLSAKRARLSAAPVIVRQAEAKLGMTQVSAMPKYIFMDPASRELTELQRRRVGIATRKRAERLAERRQAVDDAAPAKQEAP